MKTAKKVLSIVLAVMLVVGTVSVAASAANPKYFPDGTTVEFKLFAEVVNTTEDSYGYGAAEELKKLGAEDAFQGEDAASDAADFAVDDWYEIQDTVDTMYTCDDTIEVKPGDVVWVTVWETTTGAVYSAGGDVTLIYSADTFFSNPNNLNSCFEPYDADYWFNTKKITAITPLMGSTWAGIPDTNGNRWKQYGLSEAQSATYHGIEAMLNSMPKKTSATYLAPGGENDEPLFVEAFFVSPDAKPGSEATIFVGGYNNIGKAPLVETYPGGVSSEASVKAETADAYILENAVLHFKVVGEAEEEEELDYQPLDAPISDYEAAELAGGEDLYTEETWTAATELYEQVVALKDAADAESQDEINDLAAALIDALENLEEKVVIDWDRLCRDIDYDCVPKYDESAYTTSSYEYFADALDVANTVVMKLDTETTQEEVDAAADDLEEAFAALALKADISDLEDALEDAAAADTSKWTEDSKVALAVAVEYGYALVDMADDIPEDDQDVIDEATQAILDALNNFEEEEELAADYTDVDAALDAAAAVEKDNYTPASVAALDDAVAAVVRDLPASQQDEVDAMAQAIEDAIGGLKEVAYTAALEAAIAMVDSSMEPNYAADVWEALQNKVALANTYVGAGLAAEDVQSDIDDLEREIKALIDQTLGDADYSGVDDALADIPDDLSIYTDESVAALDDAVEAIIFDLKEDKQDEVDAMADAINLARNSLKIKDADYTAVDDAKAMYPADTSIYTADSLKAVDDAIAAVVEGKKITEQDEVDAMAQAIEDAINDLELKDADYSAVDAAKAMYPADTSIYTADSLKAVDDAIAAVVEGKKADEQDAVDAMAKAIEDAINALKKLGADYTDVDAAIEKANGLTKTHYVDFAGVTNAINAVVRNLPVDQQDDIDAMAKAIYDAIDALVMKDADYKAVTMIMGMIPTADKADLYTTATWNALQEAVDAVEYGLKIDRQADVKQMAMNINEANKALVKAGPADYSEVDAAIAKANDYDPDDYTNFYTVEDQIANVTTGLNENHQDEVDAMAKAINDAIDALEKQPADYTALDEAIDIIDEILADIDDENHRDWYTGLEAVEEALAAAKKVARDLTIDDQAIIDDATTALEDAINAVEMKPADYTALDAAIAAAEKVERELYTEESVKAFEDALENAQNVEKDLLIDSQADIDAVAQALTEAIDGLKLIPVIGEADYTAVDTAIEKFKGIDQSIFTAKSVQDVKNAINAVVRGKMEGEQAAVDAMAQAINDAIDALVEIGSGNGFVTEVATTADTVSASKIKTFDVKVESHAWKIQFIDENGNTWTLTRDSDAVNSVVSYNAAGEEVNELSRDVAYETWNVTLALNPGEYTVISKDSEAGWEAVEDGCKVNVVCTANDVDVIEIIPEADSVKRYTQFNVDVTTGKDVRKITIIVDGVDFKTFSTTSATTNEDGTITFHGFAKASKVGTSTISIRTKTADGLTLSEVTKDITVTK